MQDPTSVNFETIVSSDNRERRWWRTENTVVVCSGYDSRISFFLIIN